jgi:hypothetical protein
MVCSFCFDDGRNRFAVAFWLVRLQPFNLPAPLFYLLIISFYFDHVKYLQVILTLNQRRYDMTKLRQKMIRAMELKNLSNHSQRAYLAAVTGVAKHYGQSPDKITNKPQI